MSKNNRLVIRSSPEAHGKRFSKSGKKKRTLSEEFKILSNKINNIREWTKHLIRDSVALVSVESDMDIASYLDDSEKNHLGSTKLETLGIDMINAANCSGVKGGPYEKALLKVGECERRLGSYERDLVVDVCSSYIRPLSYFMEVDLNKLSEEKEMLLSRKVDYDYYLRQASNGKADKNTPHKLKMAEMALEFQYVHAKEILHDIEVSECQVGHLSDLVNVQYVYHQKCLAELEKLKKELSCNGSTYTTNQNSPSVETKLKPSSSRLKRNHGKLFQSEIRQAHFKRLGHQSVRESIKFSKTPYSQNTHKTERDKRCKDSREVQGENFRLGKPVLRDMSMDRTVVNSGFIVQHENPREVNCPHKARNSMLLPAEVERVKLEQIPDHSRLEPDVKPPSQECSGQHSKVYSTLKTDCHKPSSNRSCHLYSGDHTRSVRDKDDYSDDSTTSRETHVIPIPNRNDYRRDVGKMYFTPCNDLE